MGHEETMDGALREAFSGFDGEIDMCMFTGPVPWVGDTEIFACPRPGGRQGLVYSMKFRARPKRGN